MSASFSGGNLCLMAKLVRLCTVFTVPESLLMSSQMCQVCQSVQPSYVATLELSPAALRCQRICLCLTSPSFASSFITGCA